MKHWILLLAFLAGAGLVIAEDGSGNAGGEADTQTEAAPTESGGATDIQSLSEQVNEMLGVKAGLKQQMQMMVKAQGAMMPPHMKNYLQSDEMADQLFKASVDTMAAVYSVEELQYMCEMYSSDIGKQIAAKYGKFTQQSAVNSAKVMQEAVKKMMQGGGPGAGANDNSQDF